MPLIAKSFTRIADQSSDAVKDRIRRQTEINLAYFARHPDLIDRRLAELDREWDTERCLETGSASLTLLGVVLGVAHSRKWFALSLAVQAFFLQHGVQGWCPPLPVFRHLGVRSPEEIEAERYALKALRGDFDAVAANADPDVATEAVGR